MKTYIPVLIVFGATFGVWTLGTLLAVRKIEEPSYTIVEDKE